MFRAMILTAAMGFIVALSCQPCGAQDRTAQAVAPQPPGGAAPQVAPATQPAGANNPQPGRISATVGGWSSGGSGGSSSGSQTSGVVAGPNGVTITLGEAGAGQPGTQPVPAPPGQVRRGWRELGGRDEGRGEREEGSIFVNGRQVGVSVGGWEPGMPQLWGPAQPMKMEKAAYLGVSASPVSEQLASQLALAKGVGLVVDVIDEDGPAKKAGLEKFDVLTKLDDQLVINPPQLQVLVRMHKAGDEVKLTVFRKAKETVVPVKLIEKELPVLQPVWGAPPDMRIRRFGAAGKPGEEQEEAEMKDMLLRLRGQMAGAGPGRSVQVSFADGEHIIASALDPKTGKNILTATDVKSGKVIFTGPIDTPEERKAVPPEILKKWDAARVEIRSGIPLAPVVGCPPNPAPQPGALVKQPDSAPPMKVPAPPPPPAM
jgi:hypothetical protein